MRHPSFLSVQAVVFDFDGTLIDSAPDLGLAVSAVLAEHGRRPVTSAEVRAMVGDGAAKLVQRAFAATGPALDSEAVPPVLGRFLEVYERLPVDPACLYPGVVETLESLAGRGIRLGLCTNKPERITRDLLNRLHLAPFFGAVAGGDTLPVRKPDGRPVAWVVERLGAATSTAVMVGDNANDVQAARAAGVPVIVVSYGYPRMPVAELGADAVIDQFDQLLAAIGGP